MISTTKLAVIKRCAATRSSDGATFLTFVEFLKRLARAKPAVVLGYLQSVPVELEGFLSNLLAGLDDGASAADAETLMRAWIKAGTYLRQIGRHLRLVPAVNEELLRTLSARAIEIEDREAVIEALVVVVAHKELVASELVDDVFDPCCSFLDATQGHRLDL